MLTCLGVIVGSVLNHAAVTPAANVGFSFMLTVHAFGVSAPSCVYAQLVMLASFRILPPNVYVPQVEVAHVYKLAQPGSTSVL